MLVLTTALLRCRKRFAAVGEVFRRMADAVYPNHF